MLGTTVDKYRFVAVKVRHAEALENDGVRRSRGRQSAIDLFAADES